MMALQEMDKCTDMGLGSYYYEVCSQLGGILRTAFREVWSDPGPLATVGW
jgi:hypothetical protein